MLCTYLPKGIKGLSNSRDIIIREIREISRIENSHDVFKISLRIIFNLTNFFDFQPKLYLSKSITEAGVS